MIVNFVPGQIVLYRNFWAGRLSAVRPCRVISDDERGLLLWLAGGSAVAVLQTADGRSIRDMPFAEWIRLDQRVVTATWQGPGLLKFVPPAGDHSVWFFRDADDRFANWYVNLEKRAVRWSAGDLGGIDVTDHDLDIVVRHDLTWEWKDEHELAERLAFPDHYWVGDPEAVWAEGRRVIKQIEAAAFPFDGTWTNFTPDPTYGPLELPTGWDRPEAV